MPINDKNFLTYNQQMKNLRDKKKIQCSGSDDKTILVKTGYFNLVNGYKEPFVEKTDANGNHIYYKNTKISELYELKKFDDELRILLLKNITKVEEEVRSLAAYSFDNVNDRGEVSWYNISAYGVFDNVQKVVKVISDSYSNINRSHQEYVKYYLENHKSIPTWIMVKTINFSTFIDFIYCSKEQVKSSLCEIYGIKNEKGYDYKLLIGSLHWLRKVRNSCAHNERIYTMVRENSRINNNYFDLMSPAYNNSRNEKIIDMIVFMKFYLPHDEFCCLVNKLKEILLNLKSVINQMAFDKVRAALGIKQIEHLDNLLKNKKTIMYNKNS